MGYKKVILQENSWFSLWSVPNSAYIRYRQSLRI